MSKYQDVERTLDLAFERLNVCAADVEQATINYNKALGFTTDVLDDLEQTLILKKGETT